MVVPRDRVQEQRVAPGDGVGAGNDTTISVRSVPVKQRVVRNHCVRLARGGVDAGGVADDDVVGKGEKAILGQEYPMRGILRDSIMNQQPAGGSRESPVIYSHPVILGNAVIGKSEESAVDILQASAIGGTVADDIVAIYSGVAVKEPQAPTVALAARCCRISPEDVPGDKDVVPVLKVSTSTPTPGIGAARVAEDGIGGEHYRVTGLKIDAAPIAHSGCVGGIADYPVATDPTAIAIPERNATTGTALVGPRIGDVVRDDIIGNGRRGILTEDAAPRSRTAQAGSGRVVPVDEVVIDPWTAPTLYVDAPSVEGDGVGDDNGHRTMGDVNAVEAIAQRLPANVYADPVILDEVFGRIVYRDPAPAVISDEIIADEVAAPLPNANSMPAVAPVSEARRVGRSLRLGTNVAAFHGVVDCGCPLNPHSVLTITRDDNALMGAGSADAVVLGATVEVNAMAPKTLDDQPIDGTVGCGDHQAVECAVIAI